MPKSRTLEWEVAWYASGRAVPARAYLNKLDADRRRQLLGWVEAIRRYPPGPYAFPPGLVWQPMHGEMGGIFEIREKHGKQLFRLFCVLDRNAPAHGLTHPAMVLLDGVTKAIERVFDEAAYARVAGYRDEYLKSDPRPVVR
jgi:hypothetical protein